MLNFCAMHDLSPAVPSPGTSREAFIAGSAGRLEALIAAPPDVAPAGICVVCHPHPLYGGAMSNKVVWTLASCALKAGLLTARFNFRGVGKSEGSFDNAVGETEDVLAVVDWLRAIQPAGQPDQPLLLAGFSFGAYVSLKAAAVARPAALVSIAPPFGRIVDSTSPPPHPRCPWLVVHSGDDDVVACADTRAVLDTYDPPPSFVRFEGAGHFFHGQLGPLQEAVLPFLQAHLAPPA